MRYTLLVAFILLSIQSFSQEHYVPYRTGTKFGLSDSKGKLVTKPEAESFFVMLTRMENCSIQKNELSCSEETEYTTTSL